MRLTTWKKSLVFPTLIANDSRREVSDRVPTRAECVCPNRHRLLLVQQCVQNNPRRLRHLARLLRRPKIAACGCLTRMPARCAISATRRRPAAFPPIGSCSRRARMWKIIAPATNWQTFSSILCHTTPTQQRVMRYGGIPIVTQLDRLLPACRGKSADGDRLPELITRSPEEYEGLHENCERSGYSCRHQRKNRAREDRAAVRHWRFTRHLQRAYSMITNDIGADSARRAFKSKPFSAATPAYPRRAA